MNVLSQSFRFVCFTIFLIKYAQTKIAVYIIYYIICFCKEIKIKKKIMYYRSQPRIDWIGAKINCPAYPAFDPNLN